MASPKTASLKPGDCICQRFVIEKLLGTGGMGEVYQGRDSKLADRSVAIKVLRPQLADDTELRNRILTEIRSLSRLNHPHIATLYDVCSHEDADVIVMECVVGPTLARLLAKDRLPKVDALRYAGQIVDALAYAHEHGVIHRDVKPSNIIVTPQGIKLIDFGLARLDSKREVLASAAGDATPPSQSTIVGTPFYMAPEQLAGGHVDHRADIYSFGLLFSQLLTGFTPPPGGGIANRTIVSGALTQISSRPARLIIEKCIAVEPNERWQNTRDLLYALLAIAETVDDQSRLAPASTARRLAPFGLIGLIAVMAFLLWRATYHALPSSQYQFSVSPPPGMQLGSLEAGGPPTVSPDGETLAFVVADGAGDTMLWTRRVNAVEATPLNGTKGASHPFWSPDSRSIAFFVPGKLMKMALAGGAPRVLAEAVAGRGGSWGSNGAIVFTPGYTEGLFRISEDGGAPERLTSLDFSRRETSHRWPFFLPDGRRFLFFVRSDQPDVHGLYLGSLDSPERTRIGNISSSAVYAEDPQTRDGYLVFAERGFLMTQRFTDGQLRGETSVVSPALSPEEDTSVAPVSVSTNGILVHGGGSPSRQTLTWVDRAGRELSVIGAYGQYRNPRVSPDHQRIAIEKLELRTGLATIWLFDLQRDLQQRLVLTSGSAFSPVWSPDGKSMLFVSYRGKEWNLMQRDATDETKVLRSGVAQAPTDWSRDGKWVIYQERGPEIVDEWNIGALEMSTGKSQNLINSAKNEYQGQLSPDGSWLAYTSNESGRDQIYIQRFPTITNRLLVSAAGGSQPKWSSDGSELFYISANQEMMVVRTDLKSNPPMLSPSQRLFTAHVSELAGIFAVANYDIDSAGQRFLIIGPPHVETEPRQMNVIVNWLSGIPSN